MKRIALALALLAAACNAPVTAEERGATSSHIEMPACGTPLSEVDGIYSYSNGANEATGDSCGGQGADGTLLWQCVEFAQRYMNKQFGTQNVWPIEYAAQMCDSHPAGTSVHNVGSDYAPKHGDLIVWKSGTYGHVAVVKTASSGSITIVEQNGGRSTTGSRSLSADDGYGSAGCFISADSNTASSTSGGRTSSNLVTNELSPADLARVARGAGVACGDSLTNAVAVGLGESGGVVNATNVNTDGSIDRGLWQINSAVWTNYTESCVFDADCNAGAMFDISSGGTNWQPWVAYTNGRYTQFLDEAQTAAANECAGAPTAQTAPSSSSGAKCESVGYEGMCVGQTSIWAENGQCRVRDCAAEGKKCGLISAAIGNGCIGGTAGAKTSDCTAFGTGGRCVGDTKVWADQGQCRWEEKSSACK